MQKMSTRTIGMLLVLLAVSVASAANNPGAKKLLGTWKATIDYEPYVLKFLSASELELNDEVQEYTLRAGVIEANYEEYPYRLEGDNLIIRAEGEDHRFTRVAPAKPLIDAKQLLGFWKSKTPWGTQYLTVVSAQQLEFGGERKPYSLIPGGVQTNGSFYPCTLKGDKLTVNVPEEGETVVFTRDYSVMQGSWIAKQGGYSTPLSFYENNELSFDYQYAYYKLVPGAIRIEDTDYPYSFEGKYMVSEVDGVKMNFQRDPAQLIGTWETKSPGYAVTLIVHSATQLEYDGQSADYTLMPGSINVDGQWVPYRLTKGKLVVISPEEGELVFKKK
jgi:hypothetical protein